jgi:hypothetical protein
MNIKKFKFFLIFLVGILTINTASAGFEIGITSSANSVPPGGTAIFGVAVNPLTTLTETEYVELSVTDEDDNSLNWNHTFSNNMFPVGPYPAADTANLQIHVPPGTPGGVYYLKIKGNGYLPDPNDPNQPDLSFIAEDAVIPIYVDVQIPEFPTMAMPIISVLGLVFLMSRRKK